MLPFLDSMSHIIYTECSSYTLPETNIFAENGWLEDDPFLLGLGRGSKPLQRMRRLGRTPWLAENGTEPHKVVGHIKSWQSCLHTGFSYNKVLIKL